MLNALFKVDFNYEGIFKISDPKIRQVCHFRNQIVAQCINSLLTKNIFV